MSELVFDNCAYFLIGSEAEGEAEAMWPGLLALSSLLEDSGVMTDNVDDALMLEILKDIRKEQRDHRVLLLQLAEHSRRLEQRMETQFLAVNQRLNQLKDDLELMVKSELLGALTNFQNKIEIYVDQRLAEKAE